MSSFLWNISISLMTLLTPSQCVSHKWFHQCVNLKKKPSLRHPIPTFGSFDFFQTSLWLVVDKVLQKLTKSDPRHLFQCCILIPIKCLHKTPFQHTVGGGGGNPPPLPPLTRPILNNYVCHCGFIANSCLEQFVGFQAYIL